MEIQMQVIEVWWSTIHNIGLKLNATSRSGMEMSFKPYLSEPRGHALHLG